MGNTNENFQPGQTPEEKNKTRKKTRNAAAARRCRFVRAVNA